MIQWVKASEFLPKVNMVNITIKYKGRIDTGDFRSSGRSGYFVVSVGTIGCDYDGRLIKSQLKDIEWLNDSDVEMIADDVYSSASVLVESITNKFSKKDSYELKQIAKEIAIEQCMAIKNVWKNDIYGMVFTDRFRERCLINAERYENLINEIKSL